MTRALSPDSARIAALNAHRDECDVTTIVNVARSPEGRDRLLQAGAMTRSAPADPTAYEVDDVRAYLKNLPEALAGLPRRRAGAAYGTEGQLSATPSHTDPTAAPLSTQFNRRQSLGALTTRVHRPQHAIVSRLTQIDFDKRLGSLWGAAEDIIHAPPHQYPQRVVDKAREVFNIIEKFGANEDDDESTRYYSYAGGAHDSALLRTHGGYVLAGVLGAREDIARLEQMYGKDVKATRVVDVILSHPLAKDRARLLIEQVLNEDGENALVLSSTVTNEAMAWHKKLGFEPFAIEDTLCILDPKRHPEIWQRGENGNWFYAK